MNLPPDTERDNKPILRRRMLPFFMRSLTLISFMVVSVLGQIIWIYTVAIYWHLRYNQSTLIFAFAAGIILGYIHGRLNAILWDRYYIDVLRRRIKMWSTFLGKITTTYAILALGIPIFWNIIRGGISPGLQSYIFGFIGGMNLGIYLWVRRLPK